MKRLLPLLTAILVVQVVLVIFSYSGGGENTGVGEPLVSLNAATVDHITIMDGDKKQVTLEKRKGSWILPDHFEVAADGSRISGLLEKIATIKAGWPVATTASAALRFHVADEQFKVKLVLQENGKETIIFLGDSAGARSAYLRLDGSSDIFRGSLAAYDFPVDPDKWLEPSLLKLDSKEIVELQINRRDRIPLSGLNKEKRPATEKRPSAREFQVKNLTLVREKDDFLLKDGGEGKTKKSVAANLVTTLADLKVDGVLGRKKDSSWQLDQPVLLVTVKMKDGSTLEYRFAEDKKEENNYILKYSGRNEYFKVALWRINSLMDTTRDDLLEKEKE
ncbi:DUF4340 domain-containing protein [Desulfomarina sp.]